MLSKDHFYLVFQLLYIITALGTVIVVVSENRNPLKTISWVLVLLFLPLVGLIFYYFFGEDNRKKRLISRKIQNKLTKKRLNRIDMEEINNPPEAYSSLVHLLNRVKECPLYDGNKITFYSTGKEKFEALFQELKEAKSHIHVQYYIFMDDNIGSELSDILIQKVQEGVEVRVIYDDVGSWKAKDRFYKRMEKNGVIVTPFLKVRFPLLTSRVNYRNHRKVVVIDGEIGFMGGMNVADRYIDGFNGGLWRDSHFKLEGKAVHGLQTAFVIDWFSARKELLFSSKYFPTLKNKGDNLIQIATSGPMGEFKEIHQGIFHAIANAKESIYIQTPYFVPTDSLLLAIQTASLSGVDVRIILPKKSDTFFVHVVSRSYIKSLLNAKVKVYFYTRGFIHSKLMTIDGALVITGSANMDVRSFEHNFEIDAFIYNVQTALDVRRIFMRDLNDSEQVIKERWDKRSRTKRFQESVLRLLAPLL